MMRLIKQAIKCLLLKKKYPKAYVSFNANVSLDTTLGKGTKILPQTVVANCQISRFTYIGGNCNIERTEVGPFTSVGPHVLCGLASHPVHYVSTYPGFYTNQTGGATWFGAAIPYNDRKRVVIGADVWVGARAIILGGVQIGHGAVIGAGAVITKDVPAYAIVAGVPAKILRYRFEEPIIRKLLAARWWEAPEDVLRAAAPYSAKPEVFLGELAKVWIYETKPAH